jgi:hypothetical protein
MAETRRVSSFLLSPSRPRLPHPPRYNAPLRIPLDETQNLRPPVQEEETPRPVTPSPLEEAAQVPLEERNAGGARRAAAPRFPPRTRTEWLLMAVLLLGLGLNAAVLLTNPALARSDRLLGATVLLAGIALLVLMELCRWTGPSRR